MHEFAKKMLANIFSKFRRTNRNQGRVKNVQRIKFQFLAEMAIIQDLNLIKRKNLKIINKQKTMPQIGTIADEH